MQALGPGRHPGLAGEVQLGDVFPAMRHWQRERQRAFRHRARRRHVRPAQPAYPAASVAMATPRSKTPRRATPADAPASRRAPVGHHRTGSVPAARPATARAPPGGAGGQGVELAFAQFARELEDAVATRAGSRGVRARASRSAARQAGTGADLDQRGRARASPASTWAASAWPKSGVSSGAVMKSPPGAELSHRRCNTPVLARRARAPCSANGIQPAACGQRRPR